MGKKGWFSAMKKAVSPSISKIKKEKRSHKSKSNPKNSWYAQMCLDTCSSSSEANPFHRYHPAEFKLPESEQIKHVDSVTYATAVAEDTREEICAIKIQTAYRGYMARRAFRSLRAMTRLNLWIQGQAVKHQTMATLKRIQITGRVRSQVRTRRTRMVEVNETLQRQIIQKYEKVLDKQDFDLSPKSKEQVDAMLKSKKEAAERRKKALAYAYSRQQTWRNSQKHASPTFVNTNHLPWGWSWSNRCNVIRPWEIGTTSNNCKLSCGQSSKSANSKPRNSRLQTSKFEVTRPITVR